MNYPITVVADRTARDIEIYIDTLAKQRNLCDDMLEFCLYKVLSNVQRRKICTYSDEIINQMNTADEKEKPNE